MAELLKISVLTPSFNSGGYIEKAILSVLEQDYPCFEHIVVDGGSTDCTLDILKKYPHLKWVSEKDKGQSDAMNKAFLLSSGNLIVYLNADDYFEPGIFTAVGTQFTDNPDTDIFVGDIYFRYPDTPEPRLQVSEYRFNRIFLHFKYGFPYNPVAYFYRRKVQEAVGPFPVDDHYAMDFWFILNAFYRFKVKKLNLVFGNYLHTGHNKSSIHQTVSTKHLVKSFLAGIPVRFKVRYYFRLALHLIFSEIPHKIRNITKLVIYNIFLKKQVNYDDFEKNGLRYYLRKKHALSN